MRFFCFILTLSILALAAADADATASSKSAKKSKKDKKPTKVIQINDDNIVEETAGKYVFLKFYAPWCGYCKAMKADWEKLAVDYLDNEEVLIGEIDCTKAASDDICGEVEQFPVLKYGESNLLEEYHGETNYETMSAFAKEHLKPSCGLKYLDLCDGEKRTQIEELKAKNITQLQDLMEEIQVSVYNMETEATKKTVEIEKQIHAIIDEFGKASLQYKEEKNYKHIINAIRIIDPYYDPDDVPSADVDKETESTDEEKEDAAEEL